MAESEEGKRKWWEVVLPVVIIGTAFLIGFIFRYDFANYYKEHFGKKDAEPASNVVHTLVWKEPSTLQYEEENEGKLLSTMKDHSVMIDGDYYHFPCALYHFVENGWDVDITGNSAKKAVYQVGDTADTVISLKKNGKEMKVVSVISPISDIVNIEEGFVSGFTAFLWDDISYEFPAKIELGMKEQTFLDLLNNEEGLDAAKEGDRYILHYQLEGSICSEYELSLRFEDGELSQVHMEVWK